MSLNQSTDSWSSSSSRFDDMILSISTEIQRFQLGDMNEAKNFIHNNEVNDDEISNIVVSDYYQLLLTIIDSGFDHKLNKKHVYLANRNKAPYCLRILTNIIQITFDWEICLQKFESLRKCQTTFGNRTDLNFIYIFSILLCLAQKENQKAYNDLKESWFR